MIGLGDHDWARGNDASGQVVLNVSPGSAICAVWLGPAERSVAFSDDKGGSYSAQNGDNADTGSDMAWGVAFDVAGGETVVSFDNGGAATEYTYFAFELTGNWGAGAAYDSSWDTAVRLGDTTPVSPSVTTTAAGIVVGILHAFGSALTITPDCADASPTTGWLTIDEDENPAQGVGGSVMYQVFADAGTRVPGWTIGTVTNVFTGRFALVEGAASGAGFLLVAN